MSVDIDVFDLSHASSLTLEPTASNDICIYTLFRLVYLYNLIMMVANFVIFANVTTPLKCTYSISP